MPDLLDLPAPAKLNLFLHVVGRAPTVTTCWSPSSPSRTGTTPCTWKVARMV